LESSWLAFKAYLKASLAAITGVNGVVYGNLSTRKDYSQSLDMVAFFASKGEPPSAVKNITGSTIASNDERVIVIIGIACNSTKPDADLLDTAHYKLATWRESMWQNDQSFGNTCQWTVSSQIVNKETNIPMTYFEIEISLD